MSKRDWRGLHIRWIMFRYSMKRQAGRYGCWLIHNVLMGRWMRYIGSRNSYKCGVCGREW